MMNSLKPKFQSGDKVSLLSPALYGETEGTVIESERTYQATYDWNDTEIDEDGLRIRESDIDIISIPYDFDGETLTIHYPPNPTLYRDGKRKVYKLHSTSYTIDTGRIHAIYPEEALRLKK